MKSFNDYMNDVTLLNEFISRRQLDAVEKFADSIFSAVDIDVNITGRHIYDRINDARNGKDITTDELIELFRKEFMKHSRDFRKLTGKEGVMKDTETNINLPFMMKRGRDGDLDLIGKTLMRKKGFKSSGKILAV